MALLVSNSVIVIVIVIDLMRTANEREYRVGWNPGRGLKGMGDGVIYETSF